MAWLAVGLAHREKRHVFCHATSVWCCLGGSAVSIVHDVRGPSLSTHARRARLLFLHYSSTYNKPFQVESVKPILVFFVSPYFLCAAPLPLSLPIATPLGNLVASHRRDRYPGFRVSLLNIVIRLPVSFGFPHGTIVETPNSPLSSAQPVGRRVVAASTQLPLR
jgi:hypothetical protein